MLTESLIDKPALAAFCRRHHIRRMSLFGSVLRADFTPESDVDVLVEFDPQHIPGFIRLVHMQEELGELLGGREVDLVTEKFINRHIRGQVLASAQVVYAGG